MVNDIARRKLILNVAKAYSRVRHKHQNMIAQVGNFIDGFVFVLCFRRDNHLGAFLAYLFENLVKAFFKKIGRVLPLFHLFFAVEKQIHELGKRKFSHRIIAANRVGKAAFRAGVARRTVLFHNNL